MKIIEQSHEILHIDGIDRIERAARTCYKSGDKITDGSAAKMARQLIKRGHHAMLEHGSATVRFVTNRGVTHELVRHRMASFGQECVSGDTEIKKGLTIRELWDRTRTGTGAANLACIRLKSLDGRGRIVKNKVKAVFNKGRAGVYRVTTSLGYVIKTTINHEFCLPSGEFTILGNIKVGDRIMVNGRPSLCLIEDANLIQDYDSLCPAEIADKHGVPYQSVVRRLKTLGVFVPRKNDKDKYKYNKNHTPESYTKLSDSIRAGFANGRKVWNKGLTECDSPSVRKQADALRKNHYNNQFGEGSSGWKGGCSREYGRTQVGNTSACGLCGASGALEMHHIDVDPTNNEADNLIMLCRNCHSKLHHGWHVGIIAHPDVITGIEYAGEDDVFDLEMEAPNHNYVANGFVVHNSTRYVNYGGKEIEFIRPVWCDKDILERSLDGEDFGYDCPEEVFITLCATADCHYAQLLELGWRPEQAREVLPNSLKTEIVVTANYREWRHILQLRAIGTTGRPHPQMQALMVPLLEEFKSRVPAVFDDLGGV